MELLSRPVHLSFGFVEAAQSGDSSLPTAFINAIGTAVPSHEVHGAFIDWAEPRIADPRSRALFRRMAERSGIERRWSVLPPTPEGGSPVAEGGFYHPDLPTTGRRMEVYAEAAPELALAAIEDLRVKAPLDGITHLVVASCTGFVAPGGFYHPELPTTGQRMEVYAEAAPELALAAIEDLRVKAPLDGITHLVVASCTGFVAPGIDQIIAARLGLPGSVERTLVGFMGCYAAVSSLRLAHHIARSEPGARVLVVTVEISSLHLQDETEIEPLLAMLQFGDGATAALVTTEAKGFAISAPFAVTLENSASLIRWTIGDQGFAMHLSGEVPGRIAEALRGEGVRAAMLAGRSPEEIDSWAVHAGGRSVLDAVESGLGLPHEALAESREVLARYGNMSSSTLPFVLAAMLDAPERRRGVALAFGPGLAAEGFHFTRAR